MVEKENKYRIVLALDRGAIGLGDNTRSPEKVKPPWCNASNLGASCLSFRFKQTGLEGQNSGAFFRSGCHSVFLS